MTELSSRPGDRAEFDAREQALARSRIYALLAQLLVRGVDERSLARAQQLGWAGPEADLEQLAAEHHAAFSLGVFPYAGVFLDASASAGAWDDRVRDYYARVGFRPVLDELGADHLGIAFAFLSFVTGAQADALEDARAAIAASLDPLLAEFLDTCVLSYLPALVCAVEPGFWATIVSEALAVVAEHRARLPGPIRPASLLEVGDPLADPHTGLREIIEHLLTPAACGLFASRADIAAWGRAQALPRGFGSRAITLDNLLRSAIEYGQLAPLLGALDDCLARRDHALAQLAVTHELDSAVTPWRDALARTRGFLARIADHVPLASSWTSKPSTTTQPAP
jgi:TorA maturation chaperone TorD